MPTQFQLVLDTTAPRVEWRPPSRAVAGTLLKLPYTSDEPIAVAELHLADGRYLPMAVGALELSVLLPADAPDGPAGVRVADDVGNWTEYPAVVQIGGVIVEPEPTVGGLPSTGAPTPAAAAPDRPRRRGDRVVDEQRSRSRAHGARIPPPRRRGRRRGCAARWPRARRRPPARARCLPRDCSPRVASGAARAPATSCAGDGQSIEALALLGVL